MRWREINYSITPLRFGRLKDLTSCAPYRIHNTCSLLKICILKYARYVESIYVRGMRRQSLALA